MTRPRTLALALAIVAPIAVSTTQTSCHPSDARSANDISSLGLIFDSPTVVTPPDTVEARAVATGALERIVRWRREKLLECYALDDRDSTGARQRKSIVVQLMIDTNGMVKAGEPAWDLSEPAKLCLLQAFNWLHVAPPVAPYVVSYPMHFSPDRTENTPVPGAYTPDAVLGELGRDHRLPPPLVRQMILDNSGALRACYQSARRTEPSLSGEVTLRLVIEPNGWASSAGNAGSTLRDQSVINCLARTVLALPFPLSPDRPTSVLFPMILVPPGSRNTWNSIMDTEDSGPAHVAPGPVASVGKLPPQEVQRIVRQNFPAFTRCYQDGLRRDPKLDGRVVVRFVIGMDGRVASVGNGGSDLPDAIVTDCVIRSFLGLKFPEPHGGIVAVTYPIHFSPGSDAPSPTPGPAPSDSAAPIPRVVSTLL